MNDTIKFALLFALAFTLNMKTVSAMSQEPLPPEEMQAKAVVEYTEDDIIFIQSQTPQAKALREAIGPLKVTPISEFIARSKNNTYKILRFRHFDKKTMLKSLYAILPKYNKSFPEELIITPVSQLLDENLILVKKNFNFEEFVI